jgi:hypothetical protein
VTGLAVGQAVVVLVGRQAGQIGTVAAMYQDDGCGCHSVVVRLSTGREWVGRPSEVRAA